MGDFWEHKDHTQHHHPATYFALICKDVALRNCVIEVFKITSIFCSHIFHMKVSGGHKDKELFWWVQCYNVFSEIEQKPGFGPKQRFSLYPWLIFWWHHTELNGETSFVHLTSLKPDQITHRVIFHWVLSVHSALLLRNRRTDFTVYRKARSTKCLQLSKTKQSIEDLQILSH